MLQSKARHCKKVSQALLRNIAAYHSDAQFTILSPQRHVIDDLIRCIIKDERAFLVFILGLSEVRVGYDEIAVARDLVHNLFCRQTDMFGQRLIESDNLPKVENGGYAESLGSNKRVAQHE